MSFAAIIALGIFILGYLFITIEHKVGTSKSAVALAIAGVLWTIVAMAGHSKEVLTHELAEAGTEIFGIIMFLLAAMTLVEVLVHYRFFDLIRIKLHRLGLKDKQQFVVMSILTFFLSAVLDNLTITIIMIQIARRFFKDENLLVMVAGIVIMANAGGAWSPIGDVTTIMIWLAGKFTALEVIKDAFLPSAVLALVAGSLMIGKFKQSTKDKIEEKFEALSKGEKLVIATALASFSLPLFMNTIGLQPYIGLLFGLGVVWLIIEYIQTKSKRQTHLDADIDKFLQKTDLASLKFFVGILLSVSALKALGVLEMLSHLLFGETQEPMRVIAGTMVIGLLSAIVDNVPLTALSIDIIHTSETAMWTLLAIAVGTGGSFLVIGSVAGVVAMGMVKELNFGKYMKIASFPALAGYLAAMTTWTLQYHFFLK